MSRISDILYFAEREETIPADLYNIWRRFKLHYKLPVRVRLNGLPEVTLILADNEWACVDHNNNDLPILAWVDIQDNHRDALHFPVTCQLNYYHYAAFRFRPRALEKLRDELVLLLNQNDDGVYFDQGNNI